MSRMTVLVLSAAESLRGAGSIEGSEGLASGIARRVSELFLDAQQLVVFRHAIGATQRAGLDLSRSRSDCEVGDRDVLGLSRAMRDDRGVSRAMGRGHGVERLGQGADLIQLHQNRIGDALADAAG